MADMEPDLICFRALYFIETLIFETLYVSHSSLSSIALHVISQESGFVEGSLVRVV